MTRWSDDAERAADALMASVVEEIAPDLEGAKVMAAYQYGELPAVLARFGADVTTWNRHVRDGRPAAANPPGDGYEIAILRLPKSRPEQQMALAQVAGAVRPSGRILVYGGNSEGIKSFQRTLQKTVDDFTVLSARGHGRVLSGRRRSDIIIHTAAEFAERGVMAVDGIQVRWVTYPGLFAGGALDAGTALLLATIPRPAAGSRVLDYACGPGAIAASLLRREPNMALTALDNDAVALLAVSENVPLANTILADGLVAIERGTRFNLIVSNPPLHEGVTESHTVLADLIKRAGGRLVRDGELWLVVQRRVALERLLGAAFEDVEGVADDGRYRVWRARTPLKSARPRRERQREA